MTAPAGPAETLSLTIDQLLPAAPATVFRALTDPALFVQWLGPDGSETVVEEMEVLVGGRLAFLIRFPGGPQVRILGTYLEVEPPERLVHTWKVDGDSVATTVTFALEPQAYGTRLVLEHVGFTDPQDLQGNVDGWRHLLDRLARLIGSEAG